MKSQSIRQLQQSEIFIILILILLMSISAVTKVETKSPHEKPPIITLPEASGYRFRSGSAELSEEFENKLLSEIIPELEQIAVEFNVNIIEIIGHTDGQIINAEKGNLDTELEGVARSPNSSSVKTLKPSSNADLGMMRAVSMIKFFQKQQAKGKLRGIHYRAYSAAQLILPNGTLAGVDRTPDPRRRRIELRFVRSLFY